MTIDKSRPLQMAFAAVFLWPGLSPAQESVRTSAAPAAPESHQMKDRHKISDAAMAACGPDIENFCRDQKPGEEGGVRECLRAHETVVSDFCNAARHNKAPAGAGKDLIQWVRIPGGTFMMGSKTWLETMPVHQVTVKSFELAKTLVTNKQYKACVAAGACTAPKDCGDAFKGDDQPVVCVDWNQAETFSEWAGGRLPSEAEWEYAARGSGKDYLYPWGNEAATCERAAISPCDMGKTAPVCSKPKGNTDQGLCDMAGNAWEWVRDWYHRTYDGAPTDGGEWKAGGVVRVIRHGSWSPVEGLAESANRHYYDPSNHISHLGFRCAR